MPKSPPSSPPASSNQPGWALAHGEVVAAARAELTTTHVGRVWCVWTPLGIRNLERAGYTKRGTRRVGSIVVGSGSPFVHTPNGWMAPPWAWCVVAAFPKVARQGEVLRGLGDAEVQALVSLIALDGESAGVEYLRGRGT